MIPDQVRNDEGNVMKSKILKSTLLICAIAFLTIGSSGAYLSDTVTVSDNSFIAGTWDENQTIENINDLIKQIK